MFGARVYVHSNMDNADLTVDFSSFDHPEDKAYSVMTTIDKLNKIAKDLDGMAENFLQGYSIEAAQSQADKSNELLVQLANRVLYGESAYEMARTLTRNQTVKAKALKKTLQGQEGELSRLILDYIGDKKQVGISELASFIVKTIGGQSATITVTEAGSVVTELGKLFNVEKIEREGKQILLDEIFKTTRDLSTGRRGIFRAAIKDLIKASKYGTIQQSGQAIRNFCNKLNKKMKIESQKEVPFMWSNDPNELEKTIDRFTEQLNESLQKDLKKSSKILDISNTIGAVGEEIRENISKTANSVIISLQVGDMTEEQLVKDMEQELKSLGATKKLTQMESFHDSGKQSQTDLILLNTKTKAIARAQSKNHFASYFTNNKKADSEIDNFRWTVENSVNLLAFIDKLSKMNIGTGLELNEDDINNVSEALAHNIWAKKAGSQYVDKREGKIKAESVSVGDFQNELEGAMERLLAGQITSLLGVTLKPVEQNVQVIDNASNIFYILNGRLKKTSELILEVIQQIEESQFQSLLNSKVSRTIIVTFSGTSLGGGKAGLEFLVNKLKAGPNTAGSESIGVSMGEQILNNVNVKVSLGTAIGVLKNNSLLI